MKTIKTIKGEEKEERGEGEKKKKSFIVMIHEKNIPIYALVLFFVLFIITRSAIFAILTGISLVAIFVIDILAGVKTYGLMNEIKEIVIAAVIALVFIYSLTFFLNTPAPVSAIVSCSLLPHYERGDMIILQGVKLEDINAPTVELTQGEFNEIYGKSHPRCSSIGVIEYVCSECTRISVTTKQFIKISNCTREIDIKGQKIYENFSNDVIVYEPILLNGEKWGGDIIHRVFAKLKVGDKYFLLTKGDNNDVFDATVFNIIDESHVKGKVILRIPVLGYLKLFLSGAIQDPQFFFDPAGCEMIYEHTKQK